MSDSFANSYSAPRAFDESSSSSSVSSSSISSASSVSTESSSMSQYSSQSPNHGWTNIGGGDHGGGNWIPHNGDTVGETHYNIGLFYLQAGYTINVDPYNGTTGGKLEISCQTAIMAHGAVINGTGKGLRGGGGGGGRGADPQGIWGGAAGSGHANGTAGGYTGGVGGKAEGEYGGEAGVDGGYVGTAVNGDVSVDQNPGVYMGSGGGGGGGSNSPYGGGGGAGGTGGARILIWATESMSIHGLITSQGTTAGDGAAGSPHQGGAGGNSNDAGNSVAGGYFHGVNGGAGSGGGVLLWISGPYDGSDGVINVLGGRSQTSNGGTVKIFANSTLASGTYLAGRTYLTQTEVETSSVSSISSQSSLSSRSSQSTELLSSSVSSASSLSSLSTELLPSSVSSVSSLLSLSTELLPSSVSSVSSLSSLSTELLPSSVSSVSSQSSLSSQSSQSSASSLSSSSSDYGHLDTPSSFVISSINPLTRSVILEWNWSTLNHWGDPVTPTGFVVERKIGADDYVLVTYSVLPNDPITNDAYSYEDTLTDDDAARVFALGQQIVYKVRVYWMTP